MRWRGASDLAGPGRPSSFSFPTRVGQASLPTSLTTCPCPTVLFKCLGVSGFLIAFSLQVCSSSPSCPTLLFSSTMSFETPSRESPQLHWSFAVPQIHFPLDLQFLYSPCFPPNLPPPPHPSLPPWLSRGSRSCIYNQDPQLVSLPRQACGQNGTQSPPPLEGLVTSPNLSSPSMATPSA